MTTDVESLEEEQETTAGFQAGLKKEESPEPTESATPATRKTDTAEPDYKAQYHTLKGKYDAEVPLLHRQVKELSTKVEELGKQQTTTSPKPDDVSEDKMPDEVEALQREAPTIASGVQALVKHEISKAIQPVQERTETVKKDLEADRLQDAAREHFGAIAKAHSDWEDVTGSEGFQTWVNTLPGWQRETAKQVLDKGKADDVIGLLDTFKQKAQTSDPQKEQRERQERERQQRAEDTQVVSGRSVPISPAAGGDGAKDDLGAGFAARTKELAKRR